jgi:hypothetical protein
MAICLLAITDPGCEASMRHRVTQFEPYLLQRQILLRSVAWPGLEAEPRALVESAAAADVVLFQRYLPSRRWLREVRRRSRRLVYDFDDAIIYFESSRRQPRLMLDRWWRFRTMMRHCDAVTAGNSYLASLAQRYAQAALALVRLGGRFASQVVNRRRLTMLTGTDCATTVASPVQAAWEHWRLQSDARPGRGLPVSGG